MRVARRRVLQGVGGVVFGLPWLESLCRGRVAAQDRDQRYVIFMRQANGVATAQQSPLGGEAEPERFWPRSHGALTVENMADRAVDELVDYRDRLLIVDRINMQDFRYGDGHARGALQGLTAAGPVVENQAGESEANGESIDNFIGRQLNPDGRDSLFLYAGRTGGWLGGPCISYRSSGQRRSAYRNPKNAFEAIVGGSPAGDGAQSGAIDLRRQSINDLVRGQMSALLRSSRLSQADRRRLELHLSNVRDFEVQLGCSLDETRQAELDGAEAFYDSSDGDDTLKSLRLHMDVAVMAVACGYTRSVALQIGNGHDGLTRYYDEDGRQMENYHYVSHRRLSHDDTGSLIAGSDRLHHLVDRHMGRAFKYLLDRLSAYDMPNGGTLLDEGVSVWYNDNGNGPAHAERRIPTLLAGSAQGYFRQGEFIDLNTDERNHAKLLNTIASAVGVSHPDGSEFDDFGDPSLPRGLITELKA